MLWHAAQDGLISWPSPFLQYPQCLLVLKPEIWGFSYPVVPHMSMAAPMFRAKRKKATGVYLSLWDHNSSNRKGIFFFLPSSRHLWVSPCCQYCCCHCHRIAWGLRHERRENANNNKQKEELGFPSLSLNVRNPFFHLLSQNWRASPELFLFTSWCLFLVSVCLESRLGDTKEKNKKLTVIILNSGLLLQSTCYYLLFGVLE